MPLNYAYVLVCPASEFSRTMEALAAFLSPEDREWLLASRPWAPAFTYTHHGQSEPYQRHGLIGPGSVPRAGRGLDYFTSGESFAFRFDRRSDPVLAAYDDEQNGPGGPPLVRAFADVGVVSVSIDVGQQYMVVDATAVTSAMSRLFESSTSIQAAWITMAQASRASGLFLDREAQDWEQLFPSRRMVEKPNEDAYVLADGIVPHVDLYCRAVLGLAGLLPTEQTT